jgi:hypothetical protein
MADAVDGKRPGLRLWMLQAERDGMHPAAMGFVFRHGACPGPAPGLWDAVSDLLAGPGVPDFSRIARLLGALDAAARFAPFARQVERLPSPAEALSGLSPPWPEPDPGLALAQGVRLLRHVARLPSEGHAAGVDALIGHALDVLGQEATAFVAQAAKSAHGLTLDPSGPRVARYLALVTEAGRAGA